MKKQLHITLENLDWELFCKRGALLTFFEKDEIVLGMGDSLSEGETKFFQMDFFNERKWEYIPEIICVAKLDDFNFLNPSTQIPDTQGTEDETYLKDINRALNEFNDEFEKVVLISRESYSRDGISLLGLVSCLIKARLGLNYGFWNENGGILGSTPEILFSKQGKTFKSMALASTRPVDKAHELLDDTKELFEHNLVIRDIKNKLAKQQKLCVGETGIEIFGNLAHLRTDISFESDLEVDELASLLGPTAALGGYPQDKAQDFIKSSNYFQKHSDRKFGGVVGIEKGESAYALVAIRNIQWDKDTYWIESGGGVVKESKVENELAEIRRKRKVIRDIFFNEKS